MAAEWALWADHDALHLAVAGRVLIDHRTLSDDQLLYAWGRRNACPHCGAATCDVFASDRCEGCARIGDLLDISAVF